MSIVHANPVESNKQAIPLLRTRMAVSMGHARYRSSTVGRRYGDRHRRVGDGLPAADLAHDHPQSGLPSWHGAGLAQDDPLLVVHRLGQVGVMRRHGDEDGDAGDQGEPAAKEPLPSLRHGSLLRVAAPTY